MLSFRNIGVIKTALNNINNVPDASLPAAKRLGEKIEDKVRSRLQQSVFLGGKWGNKPYSTNPIKAHKLGNAVVTGQGMGNKTLSINGIMIAENDWYWGEWDMEQKGVNLSASRPANVKQSFHGSPGARPAPVFIPGYYGWRVKYNSLGGNVDLNFSGNMLNKFGADVFRRRGSNQYQGKFEILIEVEEPFDNIAEITDYYRQWMDVTDEEINEAIKESGADIVDILLY